MLLIAAALTLLVASHASAAHAPPGDIDNTAAVTYADDNGNPGSAISNTVTTTISTVDSVVVTPASNAQTAENEATVRYFMTIENTGNVSRDFALAINQSGTDSWNPASVTIYEDSGTIGAWDGETTTTVSADALASEGTYPVIVVFNVPANAVGAEDLDENIFTLTATSSFSNNTSGDITTTIEAPLLTHTLAVSSTALNPGDPVTFTATIRSVGTLAPGTVDFASTLPTGFTLTSGPTNTTGGDSIAISSQDITGSYVMSEVGGGSEVWVVTWTATVDLTTKGTFDTSSDATSTIVGETITKTGTALQISIANIFSVTLSTPADDVVTPGDDVVFAITVENTGNNTDTFTLSYTGGINMGLYSFYSDIGMAPADLITDSGSLIAGATTDIYIGVVGDTAHVYTDDDTLTVTVTSVNDPSNPKASHTTGPFLADVQAPSLTIVKLVSAATANPGDTLTYTITITNVGDAIANDVFIADAVPTYTTYVSNSLSGTLGAGASDTNDTANSDTVLIDGVNIYAGNDGTNGDAGFTLDADGGANDSYVLIFRVLVD
jgi:uncharacterized repeat protein (TIGR01451 family)